MDEIQQDSMLESEDDSITQSYTLLEVVNQEKSNKVSCPFSSAEFDEQLIGIVQTQPILYDARIQARERWKIKVKAAWTLVARNMGGMHKLN